MTYLYTGTPCRRVASWSSLGLAFGEATIHFRCWARVFVAGSILDRHNSRSFRFVRETRYSWSISWGLVKKSMRFYLESCKLPRLERDIEMSLEISTLIYIQFTLRYPISHFKYYRGDLHIVFGSNCKRRFRQNKIKTIAMQKQKSKHNQIELIWFSVVLEKSELNQLVCFHFYLKAKQIHPS